MFSDDAKEYVDGIESCFKKGIDNMIVEATVGSKEAGLVINGMSKGAKVLIGAERLASLTVKISKLTKDLKTGILKVVRGGEKLKLKKQAKQAFNLRNKYRTEARELVNVTDMGLTIGESIRIGASINIAGNLQRDRFDNILFKTLD